MAHLRFPRSPRATVFCGRAKLWASWRVGRAFNRRLAGKKQVLFPRLHVAYFFVDLLVFSPKLGRFDGLPRPRFCLIRVAPFDINQGRTARAWYRLCIIQLHQGISFLFGRDIREASPGVVDGIHIALQGCSFFRESWEGENGRARLFPAIGTHLRNSDPDSKILYRVVQIEDCVLAYVQKRSGWPWRAACGLRMEMTSAVP